MVISIIRRSINLEKKIPKIPRIAFLLIGLIIIFFSIRLIITYDGAHYLGYVSILENEVPFSSWDIVRGPVFPALIFLSDSFFGKTGMGLLVGAFILYIILIIVCYKLCHELCQNLKHGKLIGSILLIILVLNPLILGYFHVLLTEFVAITATMLNIFVAYRWLFFDKENKGLAAIYALYFVSSLSFCYHLKQSYAVISFVPLLIASIISISKDRVLKNILYRVSVLICSLFVLIMSLSVWNRILESKNVNMSTGRDSSTMLSSQISRVYGVFLEQESEDKVLPALFNAFILNPWKMISTYAKNYCGLSSICVIITEDGVDYTATSQLSIYDTFENTTIGYRPYTNQSNIFEMPINLHERAAVYGESTDCGIIARILNVFRGPTNILFKLLISLCFPFMVFLIITRIKYKDCKCSSLFYLALLLLTTSFMHLALCAGVGLIIDRYAIEAFIPAGLGISGSIIYYYLIKSQFIKHRKLVKNEKN